MYLSRLSLLAVSVPFAVCLAASAADVRISQVYGGGGSSSTSATYKKDYIELFNSGSTPVSIGGWVLAYGSATGNWASSTSNFFTFPKGTVIQPCGYLLVACGAAGTGGADLPVTADFVTTNINASATNGKIGLFNAAIANVACGSEAAGTLVDKVSYGTANCAEGTAVGVLSNATGAVRNGGGTADTDSNVDDFTVVTAPTPRSSQSPTNPKCGTQPPACPADLDDNGQVDASDLAALLGAWGGTGTGDIDGDGSVGASDLAAMLNAWGACPA
ncbi:MAG: hypothetical protein RLY21_334 [Planctomycetota bacterium]|jgi:hypothetical protein